MEDDISKALAYQVKKEIAERYFGYRKFIEDNKKAFEELKDEALRFYEGKVGPDLVRIYSLLHVPELVQRFVDLIGWAERPLYDEYVIDSRTIRQRLLEDMERHGWTDASRFRNLLRDSYEKLFHDASAYRGKVETLRDEAAVINEEIRQFQEKFCLEDIMGFLKGLDTDQDTADMLGQNVPVGHTHDLACRLEFTPITDVDQLVTQVPELPEPEDIKGTLKDLADDSFAALEWDYAEDLVSKKR